MGGFGVKVQHFPLTLLVVLTTLTLPCERDNKNNLKFRYHKSMRSAESEALGGVGVKKAGKLGCSVEF